TASRGLVGDAARRPWPTRSARPLVWVPCRSTTWSRPWSTYAIRSSPIQTGARSGTALSVTRVACKFPCRSQTPRLTWFRDATCQAATSPPDGAAAGKLPPGTRMRMGVPSELISQMSLVALGEGGPDAVALAAAAADGLGAPGPNGPPARGHRH